MKRIHVVVFCWSASVLFALALGFAVGQGSRKAPAQVMQPAPVIAQEVTAQPTATESIEAQNAAAKKLINKETRKDWRAASSAKKTMACWQYVVAKHPNLTISQVKFMGEKLLKAADHVMGTVDAAEEMDVRMSLALIMGVEGPGWLETLGGRVKPLHVTEYMEAI